MYFCPHTFEVFFSISKKDKSTFSFIYKFDSLLYRVNRMVLSLCLTCHAIVVKEQFSTNMFRKVFSRKRKQISLKRSSSAKNASLKGKIVLGYCGGHDTRIVFFFFFFFFFLIDLRKKQLRFVERRHVCGEKFGRYLPAFFVEKLRP